MVGHSAGATIVVQYAVRHPQRVGKLALITPSGRAVDLEPGNEMRREIVQLRMWAERVTARAPRQVAATILEYFAELSVRRRYYAASARRTHRAHAEAAHSVGRCAGEARCAVP